MEKINPDRFYYVMIKHTKNMFNKKKISQLISVTVYIIGIGGVVMGGVSSEEDNNEL